MSGLTSNQQNSIGSHHHTSEQIVDASTGEGAITAETILAALVDSLPTADPEVAGALWNDNGVLMVSAGA